MGEKRILMATRSRVSGGAVVDGMKKSALKAARLAKEYRKEGMRPEVAKRKAKETVAAEKVERGALNWKAVETGCNPLRKYGFDKPLFGTEKVCGGAKMRPIPCQKNYYRNAERLAIGRALRGGRKATAKKGAARK